MTTKIALVPQQEVEIIDGPSDEDLSMLSEALEADSLGVLLTEEVQNLLPIRFTTTWMVDDEQRSAILEMLPVRREGVRRNGDHGWSLRGQSINTSDFVKDGEQERNPIAEAVFGSPDGKDCFVVV